MQTNGQTSGRQGDGHEPVFDATLSDGGAAVSQPVRVRISARGLVIERPGEDEPLVWPYAALSTSAPLTAHSVDVIVSYAYQGNATLFVPGAPFTHRLAAAAPQLTARAARWQNAKPWIAGAAVVALAAVAVSLSNLSPARAIARLLPDQTRAALGDQAVRAMAGNRRVCTNADGRAALDALAARLSRAAGGAARFQITVTDWGLVNAFAAPGEKIVLTRGLIAKAESADEVAGVLAHEMGHGLERHPESGIVRAMGLAAATDLLLGGSGGALANIGVILAQLSYTRDAEREADEQALAMLKGAQVSPKGIAAFFRRIAKSEEEQSSALSPGSINILRSHPMSLERAARAEAAATYPATPALEPAQWAALKRICDGAPPPPDGPRR